MDEYTFNLEEWSARIAPSERLRRVGQGFALVDPLDVVCLEQWRLAARRRAELGPGVPADAFVLGIGEPARRDVTKIGGLPYRPSGLAWPRSAGGQPMTFVAQYRFVESADAVGSLPGDVLLVFFRSTEFLGDTPQEHVHFEWYPLGLKDLLSERDLPEAGWRFVKCYGVRHRTVDYPRDVSEHLLRQVVPEQTLSDYTIQCQRAQFSRIQGMKIGGLPVYPNGYAERKPSPAPAACRGPHGYCVP